MRTVASPERSGSPVQEGVVFEQPEAEGLLLAELGGDPPMQGVVPGAPAIDEAGRGRFVARVLQCEDFLQQRRDGVVNGLDVAGFAAALTDIEVYSAAAPTCNVTNADMNGDTFRNEFDIPGFVAALL